MCVYSVAFAVIEHNLLISLVIKEGKKPGSDSHADKNVKEPLSIAIRNRAREGGNYPEPGVNAAQGHLICLQ